MMRTDCTNKRLPVMLLLHFTGFNKYNVMVLCCSTIHNAQEKVYLMVFNSNIETEGWELKH